MNTNKLIWTIANFICSTITFFAFVVTIPVLLPIGDTRVIMQDFNSLLFCKGLSLAVNRDESTVSATFYALSTPPTLNGRYE